MVTGKRLDAGKVRPTPRVDVSPWGETEPRGFYDGQARIGLAVPMYFTADELAGALYYGAPMELTDRLTSEEVRFWTQLTLATGGIKDAESLGWQWAGLSETTITHTLPEHLARVDASGDRTTTVHDAWKARVRAHIEDVYGVTPSTTDEPRHVWASVPCAGWES